MRLHRFIVDAALAAGPLTVQDFGLRNQLENVLRLAVGERVILCDGRGNEAEATLLGYGKGSCDFSAEAPVRNAAKISGCGK